MDIQAMTMILARECTQPDCAGGSPMNAAMIRMLPCMINIIYVPSPKGTLWRWAPWAGQETWRCCLAYGRNFCNGKNEALLRGMITHGFRKIEISLI